MFETDALNVVTKYGYDPATGARVEVVQDFGGLNAISNSTVDELGRTIESFGPVHDVNGESIRRASWNVFVSDQEDMVCRWLPESGNWRKDRWSTLFQINQQSLDGTTVDSIVAVRGVDVELLGELTSADSFPQSTWRRWTRTIKDANGRAIETRTYHDIPTAGEGSEGTNYAKTTYDHESMSRRNRTVLSQRHDYT